MKSKSFVTLAVFGLLISVSACGRLFWIKGEGDIIEKELNIDEFTGVDLMGSFDIEIVPGEKQTVLAIGHANIIEKLKTNVKWGVWQAELEDGNYRNYSLKIYITSPKIEKMVVSGSGGITSSGFENLHNLTARVIGSGSIKGTSMFKVENVILADVIGSGSMDLYVQGEENDINITGSGDARLSGYVNKQNIEVIGSGNVNSSELNCETSNISISGSGDVEVYPNQSLKVSISGSGDLTYKGNPSVETAITGSGTVRKKDE